MFTTYRQQTLFSEEAPVKISALQEVEPDSLVSATYGLKCAALWKHQNRDVSFMKMFAAESQRDFSTEYATTWNLSTTNAGHWYCLLQYSAHPMNVTEWSLLGYWPTPSYSDDMEREPSPTPVLTSNNTLRHLNPEGIQSQMRLSQVVKLWATAQSRDWKGAVGVNRHSKNLPDQVLIWQGGAGQYLNPAWTELLMGLPPGYLDLTRLQTSQVSQRGRASINMRMNRRAQQRRKANTTRNASKHLATRLFGSKSRRS